MIHSPVLIIGCARSGTTLLYNILSEVPSLWSIGYESKSIIEKYHSPSAKAWESGALAAEDLTSESRAFISRRFVELSAPGNYWRGVNQFRARLNQNPLYKAMKSRGRQASPAGSFAGAVPGVGLAAFRQLAEWRNRLSPPAGAIRLLEKTPENCLRLPFLAALFPDARVIYLTRDGRANVHSLIEGWRRPHLFPGYRTPIPVTSEGQTSGRWAFTLIRGWQELANSPLEVIAAHQWVTSNQVVLDYIHQPAALPSVTIRYEDLIAAPDMTLARIGAFLDIAPDNIPTLGNPLPEVNIVSTPNQEKWRREAELVRRVMPIIELTMNRLGYPVRDEASTAS